MDSFSNLNVSIYPQHNLESLHYTFNVYIYHNILKFNDSKSITNKSQKLLNIATSLM